MEFAVPLLVFSAVLGLTTETSILRQNSGRSLSPWRYPEREPMPDRINRGVAAGMAIMGALELTDIMGYWAVALAPAVMMMPLVLRVQHNKTVAAAQ